MKPTKLTDSLSVAPQIALSDLAQIRALGFGTVISNRPDGEGAGQPTFAEIQAAAEKAGLKAVHVPVTPGALTDGDVTAMQQALTGADGRVLAYCRTGARSVALWTLAESRRGTAVPATLQTGKAARHGLGTDRQYPTHPDTAA